MARLRNMLLIAGGAMAVGAVLLGERKWPLRTSTFPTGKRTAANLALGAGCAAVIAAAEEPLLRKIADSNAKTGFGIAQILPRPLRLVGGLLAMDYGFYIWHMMTHKLPFLWRFHRVHHVDPDLDAPTAIRFHPLDMLVSLPFRLVQVRLAGVDRAGLSLWRNFFNASVLFHHSNLRLPAGWDRRLSAVLTTPEMHGVHHSRARAEQDSNWTSGFSFWDRLHGTFRSAPPQDAIDIGEDDVRALGDVPVLPALNAPFETQPARQNGTRAL